MANRVAYCPKLPWMVDFYTSADSKIHNTQLKAAFAKSCIDHLSNLHPNSQPAKHRITQMIFSIPEFITVSEIEQLLDCGMNVARLKMCDTTREKAIDVIDKIRHTCDRFSKRLGRLYPLAIALEFRGTEIRTGTLQNPCKKPIRLEKGQITKITVDPSFQDLVTQELIYVDYQRISRLVQPGDKVILDNGKVTLSALEVAEQTIKCIVRKAGELDNSVPVSLINAPLEVIAPSDEYMKNIDFAIEQQVDAIVMTSITDEQHIKLVQQKLRDMEKTMLVIAKVENCQALDNIEDIIKAADGIYVGSLELVQEMPREKIFLVQKSIIAKCNKIGKPVMCSLDVANLGEISEAEISNVASCISDGVDGLVFRQENTDNNLFYESIRQINVICREAESATHQQRTFNELIERFTWAAEPIYSLAISVVESSFKCNAAAIIILARTGRGAQIISRFRPRCPIIAVTRFEQVAKQLQIFRGIIPLVYVSKEQGEWTKEVEDRVQLGITFGKLAGFIRMGDILIVVSGDKRSTGFSNAMRIVFASEYDVVSDDEDSDCSKKC